MWKGFFSNLWRDRASFLVMCMCIGTSCTVFTNSICHVRTRSSRLQSCWQDGDNTAMVGNLHV
ncbi:hypothetical protein M430DRAFT_223201 [Amorphotheca resinae ATCC 22711]|uniref:Uncharacterized protein n=1 Tax=Amorphotheca resinae ATCC 22711 TaxID=857342 RepID=A0A2T3B658_AMORE|nr:hypothetical protein M430DRAFT_223201 [Amorphotheca resinae ATCC 22711]PSS22249.1 hypothetical protein M430DRAFT_223201 [Amorphotheca resinae ATCC 22711]